MPERVPRDPEAAYQRCIAVLSELRTVADDAVAAIRKRIESGTPLTREETSALNRALAMARYAADCALAARGNPPKARRSMLARLRVWTGSEQASDAGGEKGRAE